MARYGSDVRQALAAFGVALLLATGCSDGDGERGTAGASTREAPPTSVTSTTAVEVTTTAAVVTSAPAPTTAVTSATTRPGATATTASPPPATASTAGGPAVAEAGGWRLVVSRPTARSTIPPAAVLCYEATGSSREPDLVLEVTALPPGSVTSVPVPVGRGTARVDLTAAGLGARELRMELIPNGQRIAGLSVTVPVTIAAGAAAGTC
jgi:hypothetical protein